MDPGEGSSGITGLVRRGMRLRKLMVDGDRVGLLSNLVLITF